MENAAPQRSEAEIKSQPYNEMVWKYDIDSLKANSDTNCLSVASIVDLALHKNSALKIVEIGSTHTRDVLAKSHPIGYISTERTDELVTQLEAIVAESEDARAQRLDIHEPLEGQGVSEANFDMVIAPCQVMESKAALDNVRSLLVPGGRVVWDLKGAPSSALVKDSRLTAFDLLLETNGQPSIAISTAFEDSVNGYANGVMHEVQLVYRKQPRKLFSKIKDAFEMQGWQTSATSLEDCLTSVSDHVVMLADLEGPLLATLRETELSMIQAVTNTASKLLWVSAGGLLVGKKPQHAMAAGLARSVTSEQLSLDFRTVDLDLDNTSVDDATEFIARIAEKQGSNDVRSETEYYVSNGLPHISRLLPNGKLNSIYSAEKKEAKPTEFDSEAYLIGKVQSGNIVFESDVRAEQPLAADEVEVQVSVSTLNKEDTLVVSGTDYPTTFSHEIGGVVSKVGTDIVNVEVADTEAANSFDKFDTYKRVASSMIQKVDDLTSLHDVVSLPMTFGAALYGLQNLASLKEKETVLVLEGTGLVGSAAIVVSQLLGAVRRKTHCLLSFTPSRTVEVLTLYSALALPVPILLERLGDPLLHSDDLSTLGGRMCSGGV